jgi:hypothetical protein
MFDQRLDAKTILPDLFEREVDMSRYLMALLAVVVVGGCATAPAPIQNTKNVVATPQNGELTVSVRAGKSVGDVTPVYVSVANGTETEVTVVPSQVFAVNDVGERIAPLPPDEAARQAGSANELTGAVQSGAVSGVGGGALGAAAGAIAGLGGVTNGGWGFASPVSGAATGAGFGAAAGVFSGARAGQSRADAQSSQQIGALSLKSETVHHNFVVSGYVFFPKGTYQRVDLVVIDRGNGETTTFREPWQ